MKESAGAALWRAFVIGVLVVATSGFGLAGLCGGLFTALGVANALPGEAGQNWSASILIVSVPCLLIGGGVAVLCGFLLARRLRDIN